MGGERARRHRWRGVRGVNSAHAARGHKPLVFAARFRKLRDMWKCVLLGCAWASAAFAQTGPSQFDFANLREDVRALNQRVGELSLRLEQLERENSELRQRAGTADKSYATLTQLRDAVEELRLNIRTAKTETLQQVATQLGELGRQTNAAIAQLEKVQATKPAPAPAVFPENYPKEGASYVVKKGDSLAGIAKKMNAKQQDIINANKIADPSKIVEGQTLFIPGAK